MERALKSLVLIRAKHLAESVTTPSLLCDATGSLIFFNEAAEKMVGIEFNEVGPMSASDWQKKYNVRARDGSPYPLEAMPGWMEVQKERPVIGHVLLQTVDGRDLFLAACGFPLFTTERQFDGALVLLWEETEETPG